MPHGAPTTQELAEAVREFLEEEVMPAVPQRLSFLARVAANAVAQIERELELGARHAAAHQARLASLGIADDGELCRAIRDGTLDDRMDEVIEVARQSTIEKLMVANPRWLLPDDQAP
jgi:Domain of unknown function (DUF6285)